MIYAGAKSEGQQSNWSIIFSAREYRSRFDKFDKFIFIISKRSQTHEEKYIVVSFYIHYH